MKPGWVGGQLQLPRGKTKTTMAGSTELHRTRANARKYLWVKNTFLHSFATLSREKTKLCVNFSQSEVEHVTTDGCSCTTVYADTPRIRDSWYWLVLDLYWFGSFRVRIKRVTRRWIWYIIFPETRQDIIILCAAAVGPNHFEVEQTMCIIMVSPVMQLLSSKMQFCTISTAFRARLLHTRTDMTWRADCAAVPTGKQRVYASPASQ